MVGPASAIPPTLGDNDFLNAGETFDGEKALTEPMVTNAMRLAVVNFILLMSLV